MAKLRKQAHSSVLFGIDWDHVYVRHHSDTKQRPNMGECSECDREAEYVAQYPNGTKTEYCRLHTWQISACYLWDMTGEKVFERARHLEYHYVEHLEHI